jgi:hypothetical protein
MVEVVKTPVFGGTGRVLYGSYVEAVKKSLSADSLEFAIVVAEVLHRLNLRWHKLTVFEKRYKFPKRLPDKGHVLLKLICICIYLARPWFVELGLLGAG